MYWVVELTVSSRRKLFDRFKLIRAKARATVGQPPASKVVADKRNQIRVRVEEE